MTYRRQTHKNGSKRMPLPPNIATTAAAAAAANAAAARRNVILALLPVFGALLFLGWKLLCMCMFGGGVLLEGGGDEMPLVKPARILQIAPPGPSWPSSRLVWTDKPARRWSPFHDDYYTAAAAVNSNSPKLATSSTTSSATTTATTTKCCELAVISPTTTSNYWSTMTVSEVYAVMAAFVVLVLYLVVCWKRVNLLQQHHHRLHEEEKSILKTEDRHYRHDETIITLPSIPPPPTTTTTRLVTENKEPLLVVENTNTRIHNFDSNNKMEAFHEDEDDSIFCYLECSSHRSSFGQDSEILVQDEAAKTNSATSLTKNTTTTTRTAAAAAGIRSSSYCDNNANYLIPEERNPEGCCERSAAPAPNATTRTTKKSTTTSSSSKHERCERSAAPAACNAIIRTTKKTTSNSTSSTRSTVPGLACRSCSVEVDTSWKFCSSCGTPVTIMVVDDESKQNHHQDHNSSNNNNNKDDDSPRDPSSSTSTTPTTMTVPVCQEDGANKNNNNNNTIVNKKQDEPPRRQGQTVVRTGRVTTRTANAMVVDAATTAAATAAAATTPTTTTIVQQQRSKSLDLKPTTRAGSPSIMIFPIKLHQQQQQHQQEVKRTKSMGAIHTSSSKVTTSSHAATTTASASAVGITHRPVPKGGIFVRPKSLQRLRLGELSSTNSARKDVISFLQNSNNHNDQSNAINNIPPPPPPPPPPPVMSSPQEATSSSKCNNTPATTTLSLVDSTVPADSELQTPYSKLLAIKFRRTDSICVGSSLWPLSHLAAHYPPDWGHPNKRLVAEIAAESHRKQQQDEQQQQQHHQADTNSWIRASRWSRPSALPKHVKRAKVYIETAQFSYDASGTTRDHMTTHWHLDFAGTRLFSSGEGTYVDSDELLVLEHPCLASLANAIADVPGHGVEGLSSETYEAPLGPTPILIKGAQRTCSIDVTKLLTSNHTTNNTKKNNLTNAFCGASEEQIRAATTQLPAPTSINILALPSVSPASGKYTISQIRRLFIYAYTGFRAVVLESGGRRPVLHTGFWGCDGGMFGGGNKGLTAAIQILAAGTAGIKYIHFTPGMNTEFDRSAMQHGISVANALHGKVFDVSAKILAASGYRWGDDGVPSHRPYQPPADSIWTN